MQRLYVWEWTHLFCQAIGVGVCVAEGVVERTQSVVKLHLGFLISMITCSTPLASNSFFLDWRLGFQRHFLDVSPSFLGSSFISTMSFVPPCTFFSPSVVDCKCLFLVHACLVVRARSSLLFQYNLHLRQALCVVFRSIKDICSEFTKKFQYSVREQTTQICAKIWTVASPKKTYRWQTST